jgi:hypothetical protein
VILEDRECDDPGENLALNQAGSRFISDPAWLSAQFSHFLLEDESEALAAGICAQSGCMACLDRSMIVWGWCEWFPCFDTHLI